MTAKESISWFADIGLADRPRVGGKGGSLGELMRAGIDVPLRAEKRQVDRHEILRGDRVDAGQQDDDEARRPQQG